VKQKTKLFCTISIVVFMVAMLMLPAGCTKPPATTAAPAEETAAPATEAAAETEAATEEAPAAGKHFEGINIWFFTGGPPGCPFGSIVYNGAKDAEKDLGCKVNYLFSDWNTEKMITQFKEAVAAKPDGIAIMGHPGQEAFGPLIDDAESQGIIVTSQNTSLPDIEAKYKANGFGYVGQELYESGLLLGQGCVERFGLKSGDKAFVWGLLSQETRGLRSKGVIDALEAVGVKVDYLEISNDINADATLGVPVFTGYVSSNPDVKLVVTDHGGLTGTLEAYLKGAGKGPDDIYAAGFDVSSAIVAGIKDGYIDLVLDQQPYLQGYLPILQICLTKAYGFAGLHIDTGSGLVDKSNIDLIAPLAEKGLR
jgi:simple sugar transport system substrate-binding protein